MTDLDAIWFGHSAVELARVVEAWADEQPPDVACSVREVLYADRNPLPDRLPQLGDPPTVRPAVLLRPGDVVAYRDRRDGVRRWTVQPGEHLSAQTVRLTSPGVDEVDEQLADRTDLVLVHRRGRHAKDPGAP